MVYGLLSDMLLSNESDLEWSASEGDSPVRGDKNNLEVT